MSRNCRIEYLCRHVGHSLLTIFRRTNRGHRGRSANAQEILGVELRPNAAHEHGDIRALSSAIGMQLVQYQELEILGGLDDFMILMVARENQIEHHIVREQDVRRIGLDCGTLGRAFLSRIALDRHQGRTVEKLADFLELAVRQRVHRIDDDGANAL